MGSSFPPTQGFLWRVAAPVKSVGVYVHIPYCASRCTYCDFYSVGLGGGLTDGAAELYLASLSTQMRAIASDLNAEASTLYIGGGTPSLLGARVGHVVALARDTFGLSQDAEVTVEANPDDLTADLLDEWRQAGVNRVSIGLQALDDAVLEQFGRRHTTAQGLRATKLLAESGLRWSVDLIAGIPGVSDAEWLSWLAQVVEAGARHVSIYPLTIEEGTVLAARVDRGECPDPDPDLAANHMLLAEHFLAKAAIRRYEIANFASAGEESRHNLSYWTGVPYVGLGPSAASMLPTSGGGRVRFTLHSSLESYLALPAVGTNASGPSVPSVGSCPAPTGDPAEVEILTSSEVLREDVMLGLRTSAGVSDSAVQLAGVSAVMDQLSLAGLVEHSADLGVLAWRLTERGWLLGNEVFAAVLFD